VSRKNQSALKAELDAFMKKLYKGTFYNIMVNKYFKDSKGLRSDQKLRADRGGRLSPYDDLVKKHSNTFELDWRLITSQMYQESRFDNHLAGFSSRRKFERSNFSVEGGNADEIVRSHRSTLEQQRDGVER
jgi:membrane-bound lytic murein transglycosylase F